MNPSVEFVFGMMMEASAVSGWPVLGAWSSALLFGVACVFLGMRLRRSEANRRVLLRKLRTKERRHQLLMKRKAAAAVTNPSGEAGSQRADELERRVALRTAELVEINRELDAFAYSVSHDLQGPLRSIANFSNYLSEEFGPCLDGRGRGYLQNIIKTSAGMKRMIDELLQLARASRADLCYEKVDLSALSREIMDELQATQPGRPMNFHCRPHLQGWGDPCLLRVVLTNLLSNAWKFTRGVAQPVVEFGLLGVNGVSSFYVRDNGSGFNMRYASRLFGAFQRVHPESEFEGTGVGLAIVQRIIHRHGGKVWAEAKVNEGATFYFSLPNRTIPGVPLTTLTPRADERIVVPTLRPAH